MAGIYIHIPFCKQACHYCDFHFSTSLDKKKLLVTALAKELSMRKKELKDKKVETIYFGGGTPSLLSSEELELIFDAINTNYDLIKDPEITLEANPDDLSDIRLIQLSKSPINRLSIGIQSFFDQDLKWMNRAHTAKEAQISLKKALSYFNEISIDLIYGIPNMTNSRWMQNLQTAFDFGVNHISSYALTVEPKTALASFISKGKYPAVSEELAHNHFNTLVSETSKNDFIHYEISNFGKPDHFSKHNTSYWLGKPYIGIGPSAHSFNGNVRSWNVSNNAKYIAAIAKNKRLREAEKLSVKDTFNEYIMTGLRTMWGVSLKKVEKDFGLEFKNHLLKNAKNFIDNDLLKIESSNKDENHNEEILKTTNTGKFLVDGMASDMFMI